MNAFINISGLSLGMAVAMLISLWIYDEVSFDQNFVNYGRIAQVIQNVTNNGEVQTWFSVPYPLADELRRDYGSDFKYVVMGSGWGNHLVAIDNRKLKGVGAYFEKDFPDMLTLVMLHGDRNALADPSSVIISASAAKAWFGRENPLGKTVRLDQQPPLKISGVYVDFPRNSTFSGLNFIAPWEFFSKINDLKSMSDPWRPNFTTLFVQLNDHSDFASASLRIRDAKLKRVNPQLARKKPALFLQPMSRMHLYSQFKNGVHAGGDIQYVWMFGIIGVFVLILACINFMNLSTARSEKRAKEVGIRKTVGSLRSQLILQFFNESLVTVLLALVLALLMVLLSLPFFNLVADKQMMIMWGNPWFWIAGLGFSMVTALIAGSYPAFYLSSFRPVMVLKGTFKTGRNAALPRKILVVVQFTVSVTLIIGTIVVYRQIQFAKNRPVGYSREGLITVLLGTPAIHNRFAAVRNDLMHTGVVASFAEAESPSTEVYGSTSGISWPGKDPSLSVDFGQMAGSVDYGKTIDWKILNGRDFSRDFVSDTSAMILNEAAVRFMNLKDPVGTVLTWWDKKYTVIGVIHDIVMGSPYEEVQPIIFHMIVERPDSNSGNVDILRIRPEFTARDAVQKIQAVFRQYDPDEPFSYSFVDEDYAKKFVNEERVSKLAGFFALLAIAISCLGLFGLTSFVAEQREKEIGIRKVLGASAANVWNLLSRDFVGLVGISFLVSIPISYYFMTNWLMNYHYRARLSWWIFLVAGAGSLAITLVVVSFQSIRAAVASPVRSLRTE